MTKKDVTFVIPIFDLKEDRLNNLKFVLSRLFKTEHNIVLAEQVEQDNSKISDLVKDITKDYPNFVHVLYVHPSKSIHKTGIINWATKVHVKTKYAWVNDVDFYMKFEKVLDADWNQKFIKPYSVAKKLNKHDSGQILNGENLQVDFSDPSTMYISLYSALSFIYERDAFLSIGGMDTTLFGWGQEDAEFNNRLLASNITIQEFDYKGIHLWHPTQSDVFYDDQPYQTPHRSDMAVLTCHFNWAGFSKPVENLKKFVHKMELNGIPLYGIELSLTNKFQTTEFKNWKQVKVTASNVCFQKEACINLLEKYIPAHFTKIAWVDADLFFSNLKWYDDTSDALNTYNVAQMYSGYFYMTEQGEVGRHVKSIMKNGGPTQLDISESGPITPHGLPGGAWAARRKLWSNGGLYPYCFVGGGDTAFVYTLLGFEQYSWVRSLVGLTGKNEKCSKFEQWKESVKNYVNKNIGVIEGNVYHSWHGDMQNRKYASRADLYSNVNIDTDVEIGDNGLLNMELSEEKLKNDILSYFKDRNEDGNLSTKKDMAVLTCYFNWIGYKSPQKNLKNFIAYMEEQQVPLYGVELSLTDDFNTKNLKNWKQIKVTSDSICFQKEACINLLVNDVPSQFTKIAWIDADLKFVNKNWYSETSKKLEKYKLVQMFSEYLVSDRDGKVIKKDKSLMSLGGPNREKLNVTEGRRLGGPPGGAWAARREMWQHGGLYPYGIVGGGDCLFICTVFEMHDINFVKTVAGLFGKNENCKKFDNWKKTLIPYINKSVSYIDGGIIHDWHGEPNNRAHSTRHELYNDINIDENVEINSDGVICLKNTADDVKARILAYFNSRKEDGDSTGIIVYTCITGQYDVLKEVENVEDGIEYICFTDQKIKSKTWKIMEIPKYLNLLSKAQKARCIKILPHLFLPESSISVWVDGSIQVRGNIHEFISNNFNGYFSVSKHPHRDCVYDESIAVLTRSKDEPKKVVNQVLKYKGENYPPKYGMVQTGILIRRHSDVECIKISENWWKEVLLGSVRDQLSFNYSIWKKPVMINTFEPTVFSSKYFQLWTHAKQGSNEPVAKYTGTFKNYINGNPV